MCARACQLLHFTSGSRTDPGRPRLPCACLHTGQDNTAQTLFYTAEGKLVYYTAGVGVVYQRPPIHHQVRASAKRGLLLAGNGELLELLLRSHADALALMTP